MGFLDPAKVFVILLLALIVLGPERLPRMARQAGAMWRELSRIRDEVTEEVRSALPDVDLPKVPRMPSGMVSGFINDLTKPSGASSAASGSVAANGASNGVTGAAVAAGSEGRAGETGGTGAAVAAAGFARPAGEDSVAFVPDDPAMN